jgi:hypothetical protein
MGRSYWFECERCGYRARVSGRADRGLNLFVQTIVCRDCKQLYDAVIRLRVPPQDPPEGLTRKPLGMRSAQSLQPLRAAKTPPSFQAAADRLLYTSNGRSRWVRYRPQCPVSPQHRVEDWNAPNKCPRCGLLLEKNVLPFRIWD